MKSSKSKNHQWKIHKDFLHRRLLDQIIIPNYVATVGDNVSKFFSSPNVSRSKFYYSSKTKSQKRKSCIEQIYFAIKKRKEIHENDISEEVSKCQNCRVTKFY